MLPIFFYNFSLVPVFALVNIGTKDFTNAILFIIFGIIYAAFFAVPRMSRRLQLLH